MIHAIAGAIYTFLVFSLFAILKAGSDEDDRLGLDDCREDD